MVLQLSCLEILRTVSSKVHAATLVVLQLSWSQFRLKILERYCYHTWGPFKKYYKPPGPLLQLWWFCSCLAWKFLELLVLRFMLQPWWFCSCLAWKLLELLVLRFMLQPWWFCSCLAWKLLELLVLRFMLQLWWFCSCLAWKFLELLVLRFMLQLWWFCSCLGASSVSCLGASSVLKFWKGIVTIHGDPSKSIINPRVPCCNSGGFAAVLLGNS